MHLIFLVPAIFLLAMAALVAMALAGPPQETSSRPAGAYRQYLLTPAWKEVRERRLEIDGRKCQGCGAQDRLEVHHLTYDSVGDERMEDLVTVCRSCHRAVHAFARRHRCGLRYSTLAVLARKRAGKTIPLGEAREAWEAQ